MRSYSDRWTWSHVCGWMIGGDTGHMHTTPSREPQCPSDWWMVHTTTSKALDPRVQLRPIPTPFRSIISVAFKVKAFEIRLVLSSSLVYRSCGRPCQQHFILKHSMAQVINVRGHRLIEDLNAMASRILKDRYIPLHPVLWATVE